MARPDPLLPGPLARAALLAAVLAGCPAVGGVPVEPAGSTPPRTQTTRAPQSPGSEPTPTAAPFMTFEVVVNAPAAIAAGTTTLAGPQWQPVPRAVVGLSFADSGRALPNTGELRTDDKGRVNFSVSPPGKPITVAARVGKVLLMRVYAVLNGGRATVDPSTTLVAAFYRQLRIGTTVAVELVEPQRLEGVAARVRLLLERDAIEPDLADEERAAKAYEDLLRRDRRLYDLSVAALGNTRYGDKLPTPVPTSAP